MATVQPFSGSERRARDRSAGIQLRRRRKEPAPVAEDRRSTRGDGFDIAAALELHLDQIKNRRGMIALLESWLNEAKQAAERDDNYVSAVEHAIEVVTAAPNLLTAIAVLQRSPDYEA